jgi:hypothetical protein
MERFFNISKKIFFGIDFKEISDQDLKIFLSANEIVNSGSDVRFGKIAMEVFTHADDFKSYQNCEYFTATQILEIILKCIVGHASGASHFKYYRSLLLKMLVPDLPWSKLTVFNESVFFVRFVNCYNCYTEDVKSVYKNMFATIILPTYAAMKFVINIVDSSRFSSAPYSICGDYIDKYFYLLGRYTDQSVCLLCDIDYSQNSTRVKHSKLFKMGREKYLAEKKEYISSRTSCLRELNILPPPGLSKIVAEYSF